MLNSGRPRIVVVGAGFAGLYAAKALRRAPVDVIVIDKRNHHVFQPLLYQVATGALNPADIASAVRRILRRQRNVQVVLGEVTGVDKERRRVILPDREIAFDYLIVATGARHSYFGHDEWAPHAPGLKTLEDALDIRRRIFSSYEKAEHELDSAERAALLTFVVVGAGPTGVELAGALSEISRHALAKDFRNIDPASARVLLIEGLDRVLPAYSESMSAKAQRQLSRLGVEVMTSSRVESVSAEGVVVTGELIPARTVIWAAGVAASSVGAMLVAPLDRAGRVIVQPDLTLPGHPEIAVAGDLAAATSRGQSVPGVAPAAIQEGRHAARNILRQLEQLPPLPFTYRDKGMLATIGRAAGVADLHRITLSGPIAWLAWLVIHIFYLIGFRNRLLVMAQWAWSYITYEPGARLITETGSSSHSE